MKQNIGLAFEEYLSPECGVTNNNNCFSLVWDEQAVTTIKKMLNCTSTAFFKRFYCMPHNSVLLHKHTSKNNDHN